MIFLPDTNACITLLRRRDANRTLEILQSNRNRPLFDHRLRASSRCRAKFQSGARTFEAGFVSESFHFTTFRRSVRADMR